MTNPGRVAGSRLRQLAVRTFDAQTLDRVILPALADLQHECGPDAGASRVARVRAYWGVWKTIGLCLVGDALRDRHRIGSSLATRTLIILGMLMAPIAFASGRWVLGLGVAGSSAVTAGFLLAPSMLVVALPVAFFLAVAWFRTAKDSHLPAMIRATAATSLACAAVMLCAAMYAVPVINQSFRTFVFNTLQPPVPGNPPQVLNKGLSELTWLELNAHIRVTLDSRKEELARANRQVRYALVAQVFVMALLGLGVAGRWRSRAATLAASLLLLVLYLGCFDVATRLDGGGYASAYGTWAADLTFAIVGLSLLRSRAEWSVVV